MTEKKEPKNRYKQNLEPQYQPPEKNKSRRTGLYTSKTTLEGIVKLIGAGNYRKTAYEAYGVTKNSFYKWIEIGEEARNKLERLEALDATDEDCLWFVNELEKAQAKSEAALVTRWYTEAVDGDWRAAERFLAKAYPARWSDPATRVEISGPDGNPVTQITGHVHVVEEVDSDRQRKVLEALIDAGDLPQEVLDAWDGDENGSEDEGSVIDADGVEETLQSENPA